MIGWIEDTLEEKHPPYLLVDAADALAVAVCHAHVMQTRRRMARQMAAKIP